MDKPHLFGQSLGFELGLALIYETISFGGL